MPGRRSTGARRARWLPALEDENAKLKKLLADAMRDNGIGRLRPRLLLPQQPLQVGRVQELAQGEEPELREGEAAKRTPRRQIVDAALEALRHNGRAITTQRRRERQSFVSVVHSAIA
jgi:hypothetical protein